MQKFIENLESKMGPLAMKLDGNRYITAIKDGFFGVMSLLIIGSIFLLLGNIPIGGYAEFMSSLLGEDWASYFTVPYDVTMNVMTVYVIIAMARSLSRTYKLDGIACISIVVVAFLILTQMLELKDGGLGIPVTNLGMKPIWLALTADNAAAFGAGEAIPHIINFQFYANFMKVGGFGGTLGLAIILLLFAKSKQYKTLGRLAIGPGIFGINEPLIFGIPIVLNPIMMIPFILNPLILATVAYFAMASGIVPLTNGTNIPWTTPPIIAGFLVSGWKGALLNVVQIGISILLYYPFFKSVDRIALQNEKEQEKTEISNDGGVNFN